MSFKRNNAHVEREISIVTERLPVAQASDGAPALQRRLLKRRVQRGRKKEEGRRERGGMRERTRVKVREEEEKEREEQGSLNKV